jgi:nucleotide-binding universal stress UspA family protein
MYAHILVPIDGSSVAERGLDEAIALARQLGSTLHVLNVVDARLLIAAMSTYAPSEQLVEDWRIAGEKLVPEAVKRARSQGVTARGRVSCDSSLQVYQAILQEARDSCADLIVMGTHGRRGLTRLTLGSDAEFVLRESPVPVLLVRATALDADQSHATRRGAGSQNQHL